MRLLEAWFFVICSQWVSYGVSNDDYIVSLIAPTDKEVNNSDFLRTHIEEVKSLLPTTSIKYIYWNLAEIDFLAYSISISSEDLVDRLKSNPHVKFVEKVGHMKVASRSLHNTVAFDPQYIRPETPSLSKEGFCSMGYDIYDDLVRQEHRENELIAQVTPPFHYHMHCRSHHHGQDVFVLDTGIQSSHKTFEGRVEHGIDLISTEPLHGDPHGHGTQIAGTVKDEGRLMTHY